MMQFELPMTLIETVAQWAYDAGVAVMVNPAPAAPVPAGEGTISAPMPGKVLKILVQPGTAVTAGQLVLILEAMKMENEIYTTVAGTVQQLCCKEGDTVSTGDALIVVA